MAAAEPTGHTQAITYESRVAEMDQLLAERIARAQREDRSWLAAEDVARAALERAGLTGESNDITTAERWIEVGFERAPEAAGPWLTRAAVNMAMHRFERVEADLIAAQGAVLLDSPTLAAVLGLRADVAFQRGEHERALALAREAIALRRHTDPLQRLGTYHMKLGDLPAAESMFAEALARLPRSATVQRAWLHLQLGQLDLRGGRLAEALAHTQEAEAALSGWWLVRQQSVEIESQLAELALGTP